MICRQGQNMYHFLIYTKDIFMLDGGKYEIFIEITNYYYYYYYYYYYFIFIARYLQIIQIIA
jgi:hypothetical protein